MWLLVYVFMVKKQLGRTMWLLVHGFMTSCFYGYDFMLMTILWLRNLVIMVYGMLMFTDYTGNVLMDCCVLLMMIYY